MILMVKSRKSFLKIAKVSSVSELCVNCDCAV